MIFLTDCTFLDSIFFILDTIKLEVFLMKLSSAIVFFDFWGVSVGKIYVTNGICLDNDLPIDVCLFYILHNRYYSSSFLNCYFILLVICYFIISVESSPLPMPMSLDALIGLMFVFWKGLW
jgi:hypothetical protein